MSKKPRKTEEPASSYTAKKLTGKAVGPKSADNAAFQRISDKLFLERKELLHKLAQ